MATTEGTESMEVENEHAPPSSCEEAAALLGAAISFDTPMLSPAATLRKATTTQHANPPQGMHSIFTVQEPVPNQVLFVRLCNLRAWLRWHASALDDPPVSLGGLDDSANQQLGISFPQTKQSKEPFNAARSILAVLMKLLEASSAIATGGGDGTNGPDDPASKVAVISPLQKQRKHVKLPNKTTKQHKPLPPLLSTPLRNIWVECISLCLALGCSLPGNLRTDVNAIMTKLMEITQWNPRSKMAAGGVRLATLQVLGQVCILNTDLAKRTAPYAWEILQCCHKGLLSGGAGEPGHRAACVKTACRLLVACRRAASSAASFTNSGGNSNSFTAPGALEERVALEAMKFIKRGNTDKYPEVRMGAAVFAGLAAPMLIRIVPSSRTQRGGRDGDVNPLSWLEDVTQIAMRNIDDESAGVAAAWSTTLARCLCASAEYGASVRTAQSEEQASNRSVDVGDEAVSSSGDGMDFAAKFKAFSEARRATAATASCSSVPATIEYLASQFVKTGGETTSNRCGGSHSIGGRASRIGYADTLTEFLRLQAAKGDFSLVEALDPVLNMVGEKFDKQIRKKEGANNQMDFYAPSSPRSPDKQSNNVKLETMFLQRNPKANSTADSSIGRMLASNVVRCGISENLPEQSQLQLLRDLTSACRSSVSPTSADGGTGSLSRAADTEGKELNRHQLQVALIEISHLIVSLGEAGASSLEDLMSVLRDCLSYPDHGVRHEAATVYAAMSQAFPSQGRVFVIESLGLFTCNLDAIKSLSSRVASTSSSVPRRRFGRGPNNETTGTTPEDELMKHQSTLHGNALAVSMLLHEFPHLVGGVATAIVSKVFDIIGKLLQCQFDASFIKSNPSAACTCIRAGYCMLSGALSMGLEGIVPHLTTVFTFWQNSSMNMLPGVSKFSSNHDLLWVETMLSSVVSFLKFSPELLLAVPDALTRLTGLLEKVFPLMSSGGRFEGEADSPVGSSRLSSARSSVMEAYSWLPPGSFPLSADRIFSFAAAQIQELSGDDVLSSLLESLVSSEDKLIEAHSVERAVGPGQIGGSVTLDNNISIRSSDIVHHNEREAVLHLLAWRKMFRMRTHDNILSLYLREGDENLIPTPLHKVGTWRAPPDPTGTSKVRLLDSSIHVFAATFGLQDGHTQSEALKMLESLYFNAQNEKTNRFNVNTSLISESQGKVKAQEEDVPASNVTATILSCLLALPLHESTYDTLIDRGPPWMERATSLLLRLLPSPSGIIRRGAAEGLSLLATLGVSEDAHTLQSTILHSLDEVMKGDSGDPKANSETISFAKAGSLLTLACIQRAAEKMKKNEEERAVSRSVSRESENTDSEKTPVMIMMTRLLPSLATQNVEGDSLLTRTYALHSFGILISNSITKGIALSPDQIQIIWKAVESVESSFLSAWSAVVSENSRGREREKFGAEPAFLAVLLRLMTTLLPWLIELKELDRWLASRFSCYALAILEFGEEHPAILFEGAVFFERLSAHRDLIDLASSCVVTTDNTASTAIPFLLSVIKPPWTKVVADSELDFFSCRGAIDAQRSAVLCLKGMCSMSKSSEDAFTLGVGKALSAFLHDQCGRRRFQHFNDFRSLALSRAVISSFEDDQMLETEVIALIQATLKAQFAGRDDSEKSYIILQWLLFSRCCASGDANKVSDVDVADLSISGLTERARFIAQTDALPVLKYSNPPRWQMKCVAANLASIAMVLLLDIGEGDANSDYLFNLKAAQSWCNEMAKKENTTYGVELHSQPILHLDELIKTACSASTATSNNSELPSVQIAGLRLLASLFRAFGSQPDPSINDGTSVLEQYSSQFISSVKHALNSESLVDESVPGTAFHLLYSAGCDALIVMISENLITDRMAMRRLFQPVLLTAEEIPFVQYPTGEGSDNDSLLMKSSHVTDDSRSYPLFKLSKLCFLAKASMLVALRQINDSTISMISGELEKEETGRAIHSAAASIDGFFLFQEEKSSTCSSGLTYKNIADLDESITDVLINMWPTLAASATSSIIKAIQDADNNNESEGRKHLQQWLDKLAPVIVSGLRHSLSKKALPDSLPLPEIAALIHAIRLLVNGYEFVGDVLCSTELGEIANIVTERVIFTVLGLADSGKENGSNRPPSSYDHAVLTQQSCGLIEDLCKHSIVGVDTSILTRSVVTPLVALQEKRLAQSNNGVIISSCIRSSQSLLESQEEGEGRATFEKALVQVVFSIFRDTSWSEDDDTKSACLSLLNACCTKTMMSHEEWGQIATFTAANGLWDSWAVVCSSLPRGYGIKCSIDAIKASLSDLESGPSHTASLIALRTALASASAEDPSLLCFVLQSVGYEILQLLRAYGVRILDGQGFDENRVTVCAESVKVNVMAFQYLTSVSTDEGKLISFISTLFEVLVENIRMNGLPNHPSGKVGADETIGRMCAQVFVHVARTTPMVFKSTLTVISPESRTVLEAAVRADMSGYAAPQRETKKKINLKGFVR